MSRIGKKVIFIPSGVNVSLKENKILVKGPLGELSLEVRPEISFAITEKEIRLAPKIENKLTNSLWGLYRVLIFNMIKGVTDGFEKKLELKGIGYKAELKGDKLILSLGFSHPIEFTIPLDIKVKIDRNIISLSGIDKVKVGQTAARIRSFRPPEPYKGKGIRYVGEVVRRKIGKRAATTSTGK